MFSALASMAASPLLQAAAPSLIGAASSAFGARNQMNQGEQMRTSAAHSKQAYEHSLLEGPSLEMKGLKKAGINPLLRYGNGGTSAPTYSAAPTSTPTNKLQGFSEHIANAGTSAVNTLKTMEDTKKATAEIAKTAEETNKLGEEIKNLGTNRLLTQAQIETEIQKKWVEFNKRLQAPLDRILTQSQAAHFTKLLEGVDANVALAQVKTALMKPGAELAKILLSMLEPLTSGIDSSNLNSLDSMSAWDLLTQGTWFE